MEELIVSKEFEFLRCKLERIARLLVESDSNTEAAFMIGCLHSVCIENIKRFKDYVPKI
jgi:transposase